ncbi:hypothetical protein [Paenibacillus pinihumi]|uniref:hypothetical protein n=1 Tax=Paenibacillus pinihumi TaxID=669462 RepID=UPI000414FA78|nr:hypothetical protein [Paenibacillus pinihumi]
MEPVFPLNEERIQPLSGHVVCAVNKQGQRYLGILHSCRNGRLVLNGPEGGRHVYHHPHSSAGAAGKSSGKKGRKQQKKQIQATSLEPQGVAEPSVPNGYQPRFGPPTGLDLEEVAFLFLLL